MNTDPVPSIKLPHVAETYGFQRSARYRIQCATHHDIATNLTASAVGIWYDTPSGVRIFRPWQTVHSIIEKVT